MSAVSDALRAHARWRWWELVTFAVLVLSWLLLPGQSLLLNEIAILALFAVSLDLILGYAGIVSLGHAAFFGIGSYAAALFAKLVMPDPWVGMVVAIAVAALLGALCSAATAMATSMPTSGSAITCLANSAALYEPMPKKAAWPSETMPA